MDAFAEFAADGIDVLIGDSTNAPREGRSPSEQEVGDNAHQNHPR